MADWRKRWLNRRDTRHHGQSRWYRFRSSLGLLTYREKEGEIEQLRIWQKEKLEQFKAEQFKEMQFKEVAKDTLFFLAKGTSAPISKKTNLRHRSILDDWEITQDSN